MVIHARLMPLPPSPFARHASGREQGLDSQSEHERGVDSLPNLPLADSMGSYDPRDVIIFADSGEEKNTMAKASLHTRWPCILA